MLRMHRFLKPLVFAFCCLCALPARADFLDEMLSTQVATTATGKAVDSTTIPAPQGKGTWSSRTFTADGTSRCSSGKAPSVGIASAGTGIANVEVKNSRGQVTITWRFGNGILMSEFPYAGVAFDLVNTSSNPEIKVRTVATLATASRGFTLGYPGVRVAQKLSPIGKTVPFNFQKSSPMLFSDPTVIVRSITLTLSAPSTCDTSFGIQNVTWLPRSGVRAKVPPKSSGRGKNKNVSFSSSSTSSSEPPSTNPCDEDPEVPEKIRQCEEKRNSIASGCAEWKCECSPSLDRKTYYINASSYLSGRDQTGNSCSNNTCGGGAGRCTDFGECIPAQFFGYDNPSISIDADGVSFRQGKPETRMNMDCIDVSKLPRGTTMCDMTIAQVEAMVLNSITVGAQCELSPEKKGVCSNTAQCIPDVTSDTYCGDQKECAPCGTPGSGNICRGGKCLTIQEATRKLCEATAVQGGYGGGICSQCYAMFKLNADGACGTGLLAPDRRGVSMDGAACYRRGISRGLCRSGACVPTTPPSSSSARSASSASR
jgi:hypothetical protein